jgi:hypothetical protein
MTLPLIVLACLLGLGIVGYLVTKIQISYYNKPAPEVLGGDTAQGTVPKRVLTISALSRTAIKWGLIAWAGIGLIHLLSLLIDS